MAFMTPELVEQATVIIGMERRHVIEVVGRDESAYDKTFTLPELVRRLEALPDEDEDGVAVVRTPAEALLEVAHGRTHRDLLRILGDDEIRDPIGKSAARLRPHRRRDRRPGRQDARTALWPDTKAPTGSTTEPTTAAGR